MYANVIVDISHEKVDRPFSYRIPERLSGRVAVGSQVFVPFGAGDRLRKAYVVELTEHSSFDDAKTKEVDSLVGGSVTAASQLIMLAWWMKERYGSTMNQALKTVLPVKQKVAGKKRLAVRCLLSAEELDAAVKEAEKKNYRARLRLLTALQTMEEIPGELLSQMGLSKSTLKPMEEQGMIAVKTETVIRGQLEAVSKGRKVNLNEEQEKIVSEFADRYDRGIRDTSLICGITGSGKTEVYMEMIDHVLRQGRQVIVLIPEIALTYQAVLRFYRRFGEGIAVINSRMSVGERYDQWKQAAEGKLKIMIGPRSALFTPFPDLGLIIMDEEHEGAYKSELSPRYQTREVCVERARLCGASVVLGSATPSLEAYQKALRGEYRLYRLTKRAKEDSHMAKTTVVDMRQELKEGNRSIFSRALYEAMEDRLQKGQQIMLFLNRRGYANFVSCRSCGEAVKCPHCDVTLTLHRGGFLACHYCGYRIPEPKKCPSCGSPYIAGFGMGTQKIESMTKEVFPGARVLRMDLDTTKGKHGHQDILETFSEGQADILIGTQMIVKGHDFPKVTLVGILAADTSLYSPDFRCGERTFQLLCQAAGRAGRGAEEGLAVIQTYSPDHYSIVQAAKQDYEGFFEKEMAYRKALHYPPSTSMLSVLFSSADEALLCRAADEAAAFCDAVSEEFPAERLGPVPAPVYKLNDIYRKILYLKQENYDILIKIKDHLERETGKASWAQKVTILYDLT